jgi:hypothetical protein
MNHLDHKIAQGIDEQENDPLTGNIIGAKS